MYYLFPLFIYKTKILSDLYRYYWHFPQKSITVKQNQEIHDGLFTIRVVSHIDVSSSARSSDPLPLGKPPCCKIGALPKLTWNYNMLDLFVLTPTTSRFVTWFYPLQNENLTTTASLETRSLNQGKLLLYHYYPLQCIGTSGNKQPLPIIAKAML